MWLCKSYCPLLLSAISLRRPYAIRKDAARARATSTLSAEISGSFSASSASCAATSLFLAAAIGSRLVAFGTVSPRRSSTRTGATL